MDEESSDGNNLVGGNSTFFKEYESKHVIWTRILAKIIPKHFPILSETPISPMIDL